MQDKIQRHYLVVCSLDCPPNIPITDGDYLSAVGQLPGNKLVVGDFRAHHQQWDGVRFSTLDEQIVNILLHAYLCLLNDASATHLDDQTGDFT